MALTLNAEQKYIIDIFSGKDLYIIPHYQRAYSWETEQCDELLEDLFKAFEDNYDEGYFLGNIVIARNTKERNSLEVIDGQQRLITLTLLIKILFEYFDDNTDLENALYIPSKKRDGEPLQRLRTRVFEERDSKFLKEVLEKSTKELCTVSKGTQNHFHKNACHLKKNLKNYITYRSIASLEEFSEFLMEKTSLLPIETNDEDEEKARYKALKIFETINNRGKELSSSDIFKARLYAMALDKKEADAFIGQWDRFTKECEDFKDKDYSVDRIFKIYSYVIRANNDVTKSEIGLMSFFSNAFFQNKDYVTIMNDLLQITASVEFYKKCIVNTVDMSLMKWFQLINEYTNNFPKDALILYIFKNKSFDSHNDSLITFSRNLVKYAYYEGSTTSIKHDMYKLMVDVIKEDNYPYLFRLEDIDEYRISYFGRLYKGFGLLSIYLNETTTPTYPYYIKRLRDMTSYRYDEYSSYDKIGHTVILDSDKKPFESTNFNVLNATSYNIREENLKKSLLNFFKSDF